MVVKIFSMNVTIRDVAAKAGVSPATVSLVLNHKPGVGSDTREHVFRVAKAMNYDLKNSIKTQERGVLGFLTIARHGHMVNPDHYAFISEYIEGAEKEARSAGYSLEVRQFEEQDLTGIFRELQGLPFAGAVVLATELSEEDLMVFRELPFPVVFIDANHPIPFCDFVDMDNEGAVFSVLRKLKNRGHKKIGLVRSTYETRNFRLRERGYYDGLLSCGLFSSDQYVYSVDSRFRDAYLDMKKILATGAELPSALFCVCDVIALGVMKALKDCGYSVPGDISVVGFDDIPAGQMADPPLSTVQVSKQYMGMKAFQLLFHRLNSPVDSPREKILISSQVVFRESVRNGIDSGGIE